MKEQMILVTELLIFAFLLRYTMNTGIVNGLWFLLFVPFIVDAAISTVAGWRRVLREGRRDD